MKAPTPKQIKAGAAGQAAQSIPQQAHGVSLSCADDRQGCLFEPPPFKAEAPAANTIEARALQMLAQDSQPLDHPTFQRATGSWRLAACVRTLRKRGWPVISLTASRGPTPAGHRTIALYVMPSAARQAAAAMQGGA